MKLIPWRCHESDSKSPKQRGKLLEKKIIDASVGREKRVSLGSV